MRAHSYDPPVLSGAQDTHTHTCLIEPCCRPCNWSECQSYCNGPVVIHAIHSILHASGKSTITLASMSLTMTSSMLRVHTEPNYDMWKKYYTHSTYHIVINWVLMCIYYTRGGHLFNMFNDTNFVGSFTKVMGVPIAAIALAILKHTPYRAKNYPHDTVKGNWQKATEVTIIAMY